MNDGAAENDQEPESLYCDVCTTRMNLKDDTWVCPNCGNEILESDDDKYPNG